MKQALTMTGAVCLTLLLVFTMGQTSSTFRKEMQPIYSTTPCYAWTNLGVLTDTNSTPTDRTYATMTGLASPGMIHWKAPADTGIAQFRFETTTDANTATIEIWCCRQQYLVDTRGTNTTTADRFTLGTILTLTGGSTTGNHSNKYVDTITVADANGVLGAGSVIDNAHNRQAIWECDLKGWKDFVIIATSLTGSPVYVDVSWYQ